MHRCLAAGWGLLLAFQAEAGISRIVPNDYDGDGRSDLVSYDLEEAVWLTYASGGGAFTSSVVVNEFGFRGAVPIPGDFDGDGLADRAVFDPVSSTWFIQRTTAGFTSFVFGYRGAVPVTGDFDGDGRTDIGCYEAARGAWNLLQSTAGYRSVAWGYPGTLPVTGDFDGDGRADIGCANNYNGTWNILRSSAGAWSTTFVGGSGSSPTTRVVLVWGDFDGDGSDDVGYFRSLTSLQQGMEFGYRDALGATHVQTYGFYVYPEEIVTGDFNGDGATDLQLGRYAYLQSGNTNLMISTGGEPPIPYLYGDYLPVGLPGPYRPSVAWSPDNLNVMTLTEPPVRLRRQDGRVLTMRRNASDYHIATLSDWRGAKATAYLGRLGFEDIASSPGTPSTGPLTLAAQVVSSESVAIVPIFTGPTPIYFQTFTYGGICNDNSGFQAVSGIRNYLGIPIYTP